MDGDGTERRREEEKREERGRETRGEGKRIGREDERKEERKRETSLSISHPPILALHRHLVKCHLEARQKSEPYPPTLPTAPCILRGAERKGKKKSTRRKHKA